MAPPPHPHIRSAGTWLALALLLATACSGQASTPTEAPRIPQRPGSSTPSATTLAGASAEFAAGTAGRVRLATATPVSEVPIATLPAEIIPMDGGLHELGPTLSGRLLSYAVRPGQVVAPGDVLARLQSPQLSERNAQVQAQTATVAERRRAVELAEAALAAGVSTKLELQQAQSALQSEEAALVAARAGLTAHRDGARAEDGSWAWTSPVGGTIGTLHCPLGKVQPERVCIEILANSTGIIRTGAPERLLSTIRNAPRISAMYRPAADPQASFPVELHAQGSYLDPDSRQLPLQFVAPEGQPVGSSGRLSLRIPAPEGSMRVPTTALTTLNGGSILFVEREATLPGGLSVYPNLFPVPVVVLGQDHQGTYLTGIGPSEKVAISGVFLLKSLASSEAE